MRTQRINLESGEEVIINHDSRHKCSKCKKEIVLGVRDEKELIEVELVGMAKWDFHSCKR